MRDTREAPNLPDTGEGPNLPDAGEAPNLPDAGEASKLDVGVGGISSTSMSARGMRGEADLDDTTDVDLADCIVASTDVCFEGRGARRKECA